MTWLEILLSIYAVSAMLSGYWSYQGIGGKSEPNEEVATRTFMILSIAPIVNTAFALGMAFALIRMRVRRLLG